MTIEINDKRSRTTHLSTGTPAAAVEGGDHVLVTPLKSYLEGKEFKTAASKPYLAPRHHATELRANGLVHFVEPIVEPEPVDEAPEEPEVEEADDEADTTRAAVAPPPPPPPAAPEQAAPAPAPAPSPAPEAPAPAPAATKRRRGRPRKT